MDSTIQVFAQPTRRDTKPATLSIAAIALTMLCIGAAHAQSSVPPPAANGSGNAVAPVALPKLPRGLGDLGSLRPPVNLSAADRDKVNRVTNLPRGLGNTGRLRTALGAREGVANTPIQLQRPRGLIAGAKWVPRVPSSAAASVSAPKGTGGGR
jgi:hypothetical protein